MRTICAMLVWTACAVAQSGPQPPCGGPPMPAYPGVGDQPAVKFWSEKELGADWTPPACTGWTGTGFATLVTTAARFRHEGGADSLIRQSGAVSSLTGVRYWSTTHKKWQVLIPEAYAVTDAQGRQKRADFTPEELKPGAVLYFQQADNLTGKAIFRLHVREATAERLVFDVSNVSAMRYLLMTMFHPGEMQSIYFLDRESADVWRYYSMARTGKASSSLTTGHEASWINRSVAFFRHTAGIPTDQEPPAAR